MRSLIKVIFISFLFTININYTLSQNTLPQNQKSIDSVLNADGTIKKNVQGSFSTDGYQIVSKPNEPPKFAKSNPKKISAVFDNYVDAIAIDGSGNIYVGGRFTTPGSHVAMWNGTSWNGLSGGVNGNVFAIAILGTDVYFGGQFTSPASYIAKWNGSSWSALSGGPGPSNDIWCIAASGSNIYAGGFGGYFGMYNGSTWNTLGSTFNTTVQTIAINGTDVYVGGDFTTPFNHIARYNGGTWYDLAGGCSGLFNYVTAIGVYGGNIFVSGSFSTPYNYFAMWNGSAWSNGGITLNDFASEMIVVGSDLYIGGQLSSPFPYIAKYNGTTWSGVSSGTNGTVWGSAAYGNNLFIVGSFSIAGGVGVDRIARWNGSNWFACPAKPVPVVNATSNILNTTATLNGVVEPNGVNTTPKFILGTSIGNLLDSSMSVSPPSVSLYGNNAVTSSLSGLTPNTTYYFRLRAWNSYGIDSSSVGSFTTAGPPTPTVNTATNVLSTSATIRGWTIANNSTSTVKFLLGTSLGNLLDSSMAVTPPTVTGTTPIAVTANVTGLIPNTIYYYKVRSWNGYGIDSSSYQSFTTLFAPTASTNTVSSYTSVTATFNGTVNAMNNGTLNVVFRYGTSTGNSQWGPFLTTPGTASGSAPSAVSYDASGLFPATIYYFRFGIVRGVGDTIWSSEDNFTTPFAPTVSTNPVTNLNSVSATLNGTADPMNNGTRDIVFRYGISTGNSQWGPFYAGTLSGSGPTPVSYGVGGLTPSTLYYFRVGIVRSNGDTIWSTEASFTTPNAPTAVSDPVTNLTSINALLNGTVDAMNNGTMDVVFRYGTISGNMQLAPVTPIPNTVSGSGSTTVSFLAVNLFPGTLYYYRVGVVRAVGDTIWSTETSFSTYLSPTAYTDPATFVKSTIANLNGTVDANNNGVLDIVFRYGFGPGNTQNAPVIGIPSSIGGSGPTPATFSVFGLTPNTTYYYRIGIVRALGDTIWGSDISLTTPLAPTAITQTATSITSTSAILNGEVNDQNDGTAPLSIVFRYGAAPGTGNTLLAPVLATPGGSTVNTITPATFSATGLSGNTQYNYKIGIVRNIGDTIWGSELNFQTPAVISGMLQNPGGGKIAGITIRLRQNGKDSLFTTSAYDGTYSFAVLSGGNFTIAPDTIIGNYRYIPDTIPVTIAGSNLYNQNFTAIKRYTVSGCVNGLITGDTVRLIGTPPVPFAITDMYGNYSFTKKIDSNSVYTITPTKYSYNFYPVTPNSTYTITNIRGDSTNRNFQSTRFIFTSPLGGELWQPFTQHNISWTTSNYTGQVALYYSTNGDSLYSLIANNVYYYGYSGNYIWTIPNTASSTCRVKIVDVIAAPPNPTSRKKDAAGIGSFIFEYPSKLFMILAPGAISANPMITNDTLNLNSKKNIVFKIRNNYAVTRSITQMSFTPKPPFNLNQTFEVIQNPAPLTIQPNDSLQVTVKVKADSIGDFSVNFNIKTDGFGSDSLINIIMDGTVVNGSLSLNKNSVDFNTLFVGNQLKKDTIIITNNGTTPVKINNIQFTNASGNFTLISGIDSMIIQPGAIKRLIFSFTPTFEGDYSDTLRILNNSFNLPDLIIPLHALVIQPPYIVTDKQSIDFGSAGYMDVSRDSTIIIRNTSNSSILIIDSVKFSIIDSVFQILDNLPFLVQPNSSKALRVRFYPNKVGVYARILTLSNNSANNPVIDISLNGSVKASTIAVAPKTIDFGNLGLGSDPKDTTITISNTGLYKLYFTYIPPADSCYQFSSSGPAQFKRIMNSTTGNIALNITTTSFILDPGKQFLLTVRLNPTKIGNQTDTLIINNNSQNSQTEIVILNRNILPSSLTYIPSELNFGTTSNSLPVISQTLIIKNNSSTTISIFDKIITGDSISFYFAKNTRNPVLTPGLSDTIAIDFFPRSAGPKTAKLKITSNDPTANNKYINLNGTGGGNPILISSIVNIDFGEITAGQYKDSMLTVRNDGNLDLNVSGLAFIGDSPDYFNIPGGAQPIILQSGQSESIKIHAIGALPLGAKAAQLQIASNDPINSTFSISLNSFIKAPILAKEIKSMTIDSVSVGTKFDTIFTISNNGNSDLIINKIFFDGPAASDYSSTLTDDKWTIPPGEKTQINLHFIPMMLGPRDARLLINSNDPENPDAMINLRGFGKENPLISVYPQILNFGFVDSNKTKVLSFIIKNAGFTALQITSIIISGTNSNQFAILDRPLPFTLNSKDTQIVNIRYTANPLYKNPNAVIQIFSNDQKSQAQAINLMATSQRPLMSIDSIFNFEPVSVSDSVQKDLLISNNSSVYFTIDTIYFDFSADNPFKIKNLIYPIQVDPASKYQLSIAYNPKLEKSYTGRLNIISYTASNSPYIVKISGSTNKPVISLITSAIDFKFVELNNFKDTILTIGNIGQATLRIDSLVFNGANPDQFSMLGASLPLLIQPGKTENATIRFFPGINKSTAFSDLRIVSSDLDKPQVSVALSGTGDAPSISADTIVDFGKVVVLDSVKKVLKLNNTSFMNLRIDSISIKPDSIKSFLFSKIKLPLVVGAKGSVEFDLTFRPKEQKSQTAFLNIFSSDKSKYPLLVKLTGSASSPKMILPNIISFGKIKVDSSKSIKVKIENSGDGNLVIYNINLAGKDTSEFKLIAKPLPFSIMPGQNDSILIQFTPVSIGLKSANIILSSNDINASGVIIIEAEAFKQNLMFDPLLLSYGDIPFSKTKIDSIMLQNIGSDNITVNLISLTGINPSQFSILNINPVIPFVLPPNGKKIVQIEFHPDSVGIKTASLEISSTDLLRPKATIALSGNCISPSISFTVNQINFGSLRVNNSKDSSFIINNKSGSVLILKNCSISGRDSAEFRLTRFNTGKEINAGGSDTVSIRFSPLSTGDKSCTLLIKSNDFSNQNSFIPLAGKGILPKITVSLAKIEFGRTFVILTKDTTLSITNSGSDYLILKKVFISGPDSTRFIVSTAGFPTLKDVQIAPGELRTFQIKFSPKNIDIKSAVLNFESNDPSTPATTVQLTGEGFIPSIILDNDLIANENKDKVINFHLSEDYSPKTITIFYRKGGSANYDSINIVNNSGLQTINTPTYTYTFNKNIITKNGLDFYIKSSWEGTQSTIPQNNYTKAPLSLQIKISTINPVFILEPKAYSMLTIPLQFPEKGLLFEMIRNLGSINNSSWRIFKWRNNDYEEYVDETNWKIGPGDGFWLITKENKNIDFQNCLTVPTNEPFGITLKPGWNQIGSPFLFIIPLGNLSVPAGKNIEKALWAWNGNDGFAIETNNINPWSGYFIKNNDPDSVKITVSASTSGIFSKSGSLASASLKENEWKIQIQTTLNGIKNNNAEIGCLKNSADTWDLNDISEPPEITAKYYSVRFPHSEWKAYKGNYVRDYRAIFLDGKSWEMEIMNLTDGKDCDIKFTSAGYFPENYKIFLIDYDLNKSFRIINNYKFKFNSKQQTRKFKLLIGSSEYIENNQIAKSIPDKFSLSQNYPNPFNPNTLIYFRLPQEVNVSVKVYNVIGKQVAVLTDEIYKPGEYSVQFEAASLPSGIYYYQIVAGEFKETKKMLYIK